MNVNAEDLHRHRWMTLCKGLHGEPFVRGYYGNAIIVAINEMDEVLMVTEPAVSDGTPVLWLPSGAIGKDETPKAAANRELQVEIGLAARDLHILGELCPLARHADWTVHVVLARGLVPSQQTGDQEHDVLCEAVPLTQFEALVDSGRLRDSSSIAALFLARRFLGAPPCA
jgi:ADP-ribose diphosphatase